MVVSLVVVEGVNCFDGVVGGFGLSEEVEVV